MKATIVPAQITTVEDKIAGSLSLSQLLLLVAPVFIGSAVFIVLPPSLEVMTYKVVIITMIALLCGALAVRVKGRILLLWAVIILRYVRRPRYYVADKNDMYLRGAPSAAGVSEEIPASDTTADETRECVVSGLSPSDAVRLRGVLADPKANLHFKTDRKGELRVYVTTEAK